MTKYQQGWRENNPQTTLQDLKESLQELNDPFGGMLDTEDDDDEEVQDDYRDYINQEVEAINNK